MPLKNCDSGKFSLGEWMASLPSPKPSRMLFTPSLRSNPIHIGLRSEYAI